MVDLFRISGVDTVPELARRNAANLAKNSLRATKPIASPAVSSPKRK